ncbi:linoleate 13S-lipoxygenase 2-1, chloroplastic-like [Cucurbita pepo subsp. pepo]|uniref:linoleate 13S-lipoxygenase 2-1, chloroplastic-like n=1 Tax=Cucurbita pepo subsp. pepo TaxID=3664 RepID=UPI000C9D4414|nr:linoleate 13S-lipoxygenase 2-1, chloroplastic-like [Cucurbita pepo subsp. pepo]
MLKSQLSHYSALDPLNCVNPNLFLLTHAKPLLPIRSGPQRQTPKQNVNSLRLRLPPRPAVIRATSVASSTEKPLSVKVLVTVQRTLGSGLYLERGLDDIADLFGKSLFLKMCVAVTGLEKATIRHYAHKEDTEGDEITYEADFKIPPDFGIIGAIFVENEHHKEIYVKDIVLEGHPIGPLHFVCSSWVNEKDLPDSKRIFFTTKSYLPSNTPEGLKKLREEELKAVRGNGVGKRESHERIYDYDVYNDLGDPNKNLEYKRPVLGGKQFPYPRRCRTGRPRASRDPVSESRSSSNYVPRDEAFSALKQATFNARSLNSVLNGLIPALESVSTDNDIRFPHFPAIDDLFDNGVPLPPSKGGWKLATLLPRIIDTIVDSAEDILRFHPPQTFDRDKFFWFRDEEFGRQTLAGLNPYSLRLVTEWPLKSKLDPAVYGPPESEITGKIIEQQIRGFMTLDEALTKKRLFILDYHDLLLPYVAKVRKLKGTTLYGSRTLFFLHSDSTLKPLAIELTRPPIDGKPQWKTVFTPFWDATSVWLWRIAKAHVLAHDSGYHQLVSHWLRTHCCVEPYIIASNRQLSAMHPIYRLLHPHFRYTMEINALARQALINANGIIETSFSPGKYSMEFSSVAYKEQWQFNLEALPADLINRGLAVEDPNAPHGLKLTIEDYPFANDGLILWDAIKDWATEYVNYYYPDPSLVKSDEELQAWWTEIRTEGHADKKDEPWWPVLNTPEDLISIVATIMWVTSGHHAAVNFGQYSFAGYFPNRPSIARINVPVEEKNKEKWECFLNKPENVLLETFPTQLQATKVTAVLNILSSHSPDEEYMGKDMEQAWADEPFIKGAFEKFSGRLKELEGIIDKRNADPNLKNRHGAGVAPYELLKPESEPGVTGKGVPYSISI